MNTGHHEFLAQDRVIWGKPAAQAVVEEADRRAAQRLFIVTGRTLNVKREQLAQIAEDAKDNLCVRANPRPITGAARLTKLLEMAWQPAQATDAKEFALRLYGHARQADAWCVSWTYLRTITTFVVKN